MKEPGTYVLLLGSLLLIASVLAGKFFSRFGFSTLIITLGVGVAFGNGGQYDFDYNYPELTLHISELALCFIIFAGGFNSSWKKLAPYKWHGLLMATTGVFLTMLIVAMIPYLFFNWGMIESLLLGAVVSATDAAAVFSILESSGLKLKSGLTETLELESGTNDPMAYFLTTGLTALLVLPNDTSYSFLIGKFALSMGIGVASGYLVGRVVRWIILKAKLKRGQNPVLLIGIVLFLYAANVVSGGSAFLAVYVTGIMLANTEWSTKQFNTHFFEGFSWLMETILFLLLGLQLYIFEIPEVLWEGLLISCVLIMVARPFATHVSLFFLPDFSWRKAAFVSWVGLRGATPIVFALIPLIYHVPEAHAILNISFIVVVTSILIQGNIIAWLARWLNVKEV